MYIYLLLLLLSLSLSLTLGEDDDDSIDFDDHPQHTIMSLSFSLSVLSLMSLLSSAQIAQQNTTKHLCTHSLSYYIL